MFKNSIIASTCTIFEDSCTIEIKVPLRVLYFLQGAEKYQCSKRRSSCLSRTKKERALVIFSFTQQENILRITKVAQIEGIYITSKSVVHS